MMYVGKPPWHGLGTSLFQPATALEAIQAANLGCNVVKQPLYMGDPDECLYPVDGKYAIVPADKWGNTECPIFGIVGPEYTPLQNSKAFEFFDPIIGEGAAIYHTAGALDDGQRIWILAKLPSYIEVANDDITDKYLLLSNSHDGNSSVQIKFTPIRVVCWNTLTMALKHGSTVRVPHRRDVQRRLEEARTLLKIIDTRYLEIEYTFKAMAKTRFNTPRLYEFLNRVFPDPSDPSDVRGRRRIEQMRTAAAELFEQGRGNQKPAVSGTLWAAYNGVTELIDHKASSDKAAHLDSIWFGNGYLTKARAYEVAKQMAGAGHPT